jgi:hypothetical protein
MYPGVNSAGIGRDPSGATIIPIVASSILVAGHGGGVTQTLTLTLLVAGHGPVASPSPQMRGTRGCYNGKNSTVPLASPSSQLLKYFILPHTTIRSNFISDTKHSRASNDEEGASAVAADLHCGGAIRAGWQSSW